MLTDTEKIEFFKKTFGQKVEIDGTGKNAAFSCPNKSCVSNIKGKLKFVVRLDDTACHCWVCGLKGKSVSYVIRKFRPEKLEEYAKKFLTDAEFRNLLSRKEDYQTSQETHTAAKLELPEDFTLLASVKIQKESGRKTPKDFSDCLLYVESRGITQELLWRYKVGVSLDRDFRRQIIFPSFDAEGKLNFIVCRKIDESKYKYVNHGEKSSSIIFDEISIDFKKPIHIFEGPFDLLHANVNGTILLGSSMSTKSELYKKLLQNAKDVVLCLDPDAYEKSIWIFKLLSKAGLNVKHTTFPLESDPGDLCRTEILSCIAAAKEIQWKDDIINKIAKIRTSSFL